MNKVLARKQADRRRVLDYLYRSMLPGVEHANMSAERVAPEVGLTHGVAGSRIKEISDAGILARRMEMRPTTHGFSAGRIWFWTLLVPKDEAERILAKFEKDEERNYQMGKPRTAPKSEYVKNMVAVRESNGEPVEAIAGPDAPTPFEQLRTLRRDESYALVEAARQYASRDTTFYSSIDSLVKQAKELGVKIDVNALMDSITIEKDERLDNVALVLPYIDRLEKELARLQATLTVAQDRIRHYEKLEHEAKVLREQNQRLIAQRVAIQ